MGKTIIGVFLGISLILLGASGGAVLAQDLFGRDISRMDLEQRLDCYNRASSVSEAEACVPGDQGFGEQEFLEDAGDKDQDGIDMCILWSSSPAEVNACIAAGSRPPTTLSP